MPGPETAPHPFSTAHPSSGAAHSAPGAHSPSGAAHASSGTRSAPPAVADTASDVVRWAAFSCVLVPVVLVWYGTSLAGAAGTALGLATVTGACRVLLRQSERGAARLRAEGVPVRGEGTRARTEERAPQRGRHGRGGPDATGGGHRRSGGGIGSGGWSGGAQGTGGGPGATGGAYGRSGGGAHRGGRHGGGNKPVD
ncbi:hypothetical protein ACFVXW_04525 [Streptomyces sp. NPDC058251]|uniref:hypothetical protein n=1 Tax=Streptomyces sp. NPDC058251 TaxID=3346404 RepID=UPI0036EBD890